MAVKKRNKKSADTDAEHIVQDNVQRCESADDADKSPSASEASDTETVPEPEPVSVSVSEGTDSEDGSVPVQEGESVTAQDSMPEEPKRIRRASRSRRDEKRNQDVSGEETETSANPDEAVPDVHVTDAEEAVMKEMSRPVHIVRTPISELVSQASRMTAEEMDAEAANPEKHDNEKPIAIARMPMTDTQKDVMSSDDWFEDAKKTPVLKSRPGDDYKDISDRPVQMEIRNEGRSRLRDVMQNFEDVTTEAEYEFVDEHEDIPCDITAKHESDDPDADFLMVHNHAVSDDGEIADDADDAPEDPEDSDDVADMDDADDDDTQAVTVAGPYDVDEPSEDEPSENSKDRYIACCLCDVEHFEKDSDVVLQVVPCGQSKYASDRLSDRSEKRMKPSSRVCIKKSACVSASEFRRQRDTSLSEFPYYRFDGHVFGYEVFDDCIDADAHLSNVMVFTSRGIYSFYVCLDKDGIDAVLGKAGDMTAGFESLLNSLPFCGMEYLPVDAMDNWEPLEDVVSVDVLQYGILSVTTEHAEEIYHLDMSMPVDFVGVLDEIVSQFEKKEPDVGFITAYFVHMYDAVEEA